MYLRAGFRPIATCSPSNFDLVLRFGAEKVFDYANLDCAAEIRAYTKNTLQYAFDCVAMPETTMLCYGAIGRAGGRYVTLEPFRAEATAARPLTIEPSWILALTVYGRKVSYGGEYDRDACPEDLEFGKRFVKIAQALLDQGKLDTHPVKVITGGWEKVMEGVEFIRQDAMSGAKLVYPVS